MGQLGLRLQFGPFSLFLNVEGNPARRANVKTTLPNFFEPYPEFVDMPARNLEWWLLDGGAAWRISSAYRIIGGLKVDHLSTGLGNATVDLPSGTRTWTCLDWGHSDEDVDSVCRTRNAWGQLQVQFFSLTVFVE